MGYSRPPGRNSRDRNSRDRDSRDSSSYKPEDEQFLFAIETELKEFMENEEEILHLDPMNSYQRRLVHQFTKEYKLDSNSEGDEENRHIVLKKNEQSSVPEIRILKKKFFDYGNREFFVPFHEGTDIVLEQDGSIGIYEGQSENRILDRKTVYNGSFKIRKNKIVEFSDKEW